MRIQSAQTSDNASETIARSCNHIDMSKNQTALNAVIPPIPLLSGWISKLDVCNPGGRRGKTPACQCHLAGGPAINLTSAIANPAPIVAPAVRKG